MLDLTGIMFSSIMMLLIIVRAVRLDRQRPWFQPIKVKASRPGQGRARGRG